MEAAAIVNARYQGIAAAVAALARGDRISRKIRGGRLSITECETAFLLVQRLGVSLADLEAAGPAPADLDTIRQMFARLDEFWRRKPCMRYTVSLKAKGKRQSNKG
jgi:hypothetical protein